MGHLKIAVGESGWLRDTNGAERRRITLEQRMNPATAKPADARFAVYVAMRQVDAHAVTTWPPVRALADVALFELTTKRDDAIAYNDATLSGGYVGSGASPDEPVFVDMTADTKTLVAHAGGIKHDHVTVTVRSIAQRPVRFTKGPTSATAPTCYHFVYVARVEVVAGRRFGPGDSGTPFYDTMGRLHSFLVETANELGDVDMLILEPASVALAQLRILCDDATLVFATPHEKLAASAHLPVRRSGRWSLDNSGPLAVYGAQYAAYDADTVHEALYAAQEAHGISWWSVAAAVCVSVGIGAVLAGSHAVALPVIGAGVVATAIAAQDMGPQREARTAYHALVEE